MIHGLVLSAALFVNFSARHACADEVQTAGKTIRAQSSISPSDFLLNAFFLPYVIACSLPHYGFTEYPYETENGYGNGGRAMAITGGTATLFNRGGHQAQTAQFRVRGENRLGWDFGFTTYDKGSFGVARRAGYYNGHITANYLQTKTSLLEFGLGFASFQNPNEKWGASAELVYELFPIKPWTASLRYEVSTLQGQGYHELSAEFGASWKWIGIGAGYRALLNPARNAYGPEVFIRGWF